MGLGPTGSFRGTLRRKPVLSLLNSAPTPPDNDERWELGFELLPEPCPAGGIIDPCDSDTEKGVAAPAGIISGQPFGIYESASCSTFTRDEINELPVKARRLLEVTESSKIANEFWEGTQTQASAWGNQYLKDGPLILGTSLSPLDALSCLEQSLAECLDGSPGMIHATRHVVSQWVAMQAVYCVEISPGAKIMYDKYDNIVVPDAGYTGSAPDGEVDNIGESWAYATGMVQVYRRPEIDMVPDTSQEGWIAQATRRTENTVEVIAEKLAVVTFDPCCHSAVGVTVVRCEGLEFAS